MPKTNDVWGLFDEFVNLIERANKLHDDLIAVETAERELKARIYPILLGEKMVEHRGKIIFLKDDGSICVREPKSSINIELEMEEKPTEEASS